MRCPKLNDLPPPPQDKTGWPWTVESPQLPNVMQNGELWPRVSIVTPSYNQGKFIEETIRSVLLQGYPDLEYIIMDGISTDNSVEIIKKYENWLTYWVSEKDKGQSDAINRGLNKASGILSNWLNSDDYLLPGGLRRIATAYLLDVSALLYNASAKYLDYRNERVRFFNAVSLTACDVIQTETVPILQPAVFFKLDVWKDIGLNRNLFYVMDLDFYCRCLIEGHSQVIAGDPVVVMRGHLDAKTVKYDAMKPMVLERYGMFLDYLKSGFSSEYIRFIKYGLARESFRMSQLCMQRDHNIFASLHWLLKALRHSFGRTIYHSFLKRFRSLR